MRKVGSHIVEALVERQVVTAELDQYGDLREQIKEAAAAELAARGIEIENEGGQ